MEEQYGYNSYCSLFGNHKGDPCACGWSTKVEYNEFSQGLLHFVRIYKTEHENKEPKSIGEFLAWVLTKAWG